MSFIFNIERQERTFSTVINSFLLQQRSYINSQITAVLYTIWKVESKNGFKLDLFFFLHIIEERSVEGYMYVTDHQFQSE